MRVGFVGLGKLGLPVALAVESRGHEVMGYDTNPAIEGHIEAREIPYKEKGLQPLLDETKLHVAQSVGEVVAESDIVFLPIQTPHDPQYEGITRIPDDRKDFEYKFLESALADVANACNKQMLKRTVAVISTCLPGTYEKRLKPIVEGEVQYAYTPQFIAMGTVLEDYLNPEFNLIGVEDEEAAEQLEEFYSTINDAPTVRTDITTAEGIKVSYNTWITAKTVVANAWGEMAEKMGMKFSDIKKAWDLSTKRIHSQKYTDAGMSDGGSCHPRDNIAMSWLAKEVGMSHDIWSDLMQAREDFEEWHADLAQQIAEEEGLPLMILGESFKPETNITTGSPAKLMAKILEERGVEFEHVEDSTLCRKRVYFIGTKNDRYRNLCFPKGSVVIDPFRYISDQAGVDIRRLGEKVV